MSLDFKDKVAIVTGAGGGLGRIYALALGKRGCKVVVNDLGGNTRGEGKDTSAADKVVNEIKAAGGEAVANYDSVVEGAKIVETAIKTWGRIDVVVNNAGILRDVSFLKMTDQDWKLLVDVHLHGAYQVTKAAWPHMRKQNYGRVIMVTSCAGLYGNHGQAHYSAVKMGLVGLAKTLAHEGAKNNIKVNVIAPIAGSRMTETVMPPDLLKALKPDYVAPLVEYLCHSSCESSGGIFEVGGGWVSAVRWQRSKGELFPLNDKFNIEAVRDSMKKINDFTDPVYPTGGKDAFEAIMSNLNNTGDNANDSSASSTPKKAAKSSGGNNPNVDVKTALAHTFPSIKHSYTERDIILYALGIGAAADPMDTSELKFVYENHESFQALPTFGVVIPSAALESIVSTPGLTFNPMMILHGEQFMELKAPLPTNGTLISEPRILNIFDKGSGALVVLGVNTKDEKGNIVLYNQYSLFIRGLGNFGGDKGPSAVSYDPPVNQPPQVVHRERTLDNAAILYRLSGDYNPLHIDPTLAESAGFKKPILHGLCTFGYATRAVIKHFCQNDASRFKSINVRFVKHVFPGETIITEMWKASSTKIIFRCRVAERGEVVLANACIELHPTEEEKKAAAAAAASASTSSSPASSASTKASASTGFAAEAVFKTLEAQASEDIVKKIKATYRFDISKGDKKQSWLLDLKTGKGSISLSDDKTKADCMIQITDEDSVALMSGKADAMKLFTSGKIKIKGNMMLGTKLQMLQPKQSKL